MSECIVKVVGRKPNAKKKSLSFIAVCSKLDHTWFTEFTLENFVSAYKSALKHLFLLPNCPWSKLESYENSYLDNLQDQLSLLFYHLRFRADLFTYPQIKELLLYDNTEDNCLLKSPIEFVSLIKASDVYTITAFQLVPSVKGIISCCEYVTRFRGIGKLWSLIETPFMGEVVVLGFDEALFKIASQEVEQAVKCCYWNENSFEAIFGLESGDILLIKCKMKLAANSKGVFDSDKLSISSKHILSLHSTSIISISGFENLIFTISIDNMLKVSICSNQNIELKGGGSLKKRLNTDKLKCIQADSLTKKIFLGTEQGKIFVYCLDNLSPKFLYMFSCESCIRDLDIKYGIVYVGAGACIMAFSDNKESDLLSRFHPQLEDCEITCIRYAKSKDMVYAGYSNGMLVIWHALVFQLLLALKIFEENVVRIEVDEKNGLLAAANGYSEVKIFRL
ncbi:hypothetical protein SteCoe_22323 [Stentor coeruleus]|uniref:Uncharacterized protein n=1 Tax=Stentor coeruleus TaxID=5963 RepID=A0A1R2BMB8_9CILI|nr:hypothetical protein SteCoe_22323 [Stentor coeruleus]